MPKVSYVAVAAALLAGLVLQAQMNDPPLVVELKALVNAPTAERPAATLKAASEIRALPVGLFKLQCADALAQISMRDDPGAQAFDAVAAALDEALGSFSVSGRDGQPAEPYLDLAQLVRYDHIGVALDDPHFAQAMAELAAADQKVERSDFSLKDLGGRSYTLSQLRGKVVLVNFWASWCGPCRVEMPDLESLYAHFKSRGLVVLAISNEKEATVRAAAAKMGITVPVLLDPGAVVGHRFGLEGLPRSFVFNRQGKLVAVAVDKRSRRQFLAMLAAAGLHP